MDYYKVDQVVTPVAVLYQMLFHCLSKLTYPWCLQQMPFSLLVNKAHQKQFVFVFTWQNPQYSHTVLPYGMSTLHSYIISSSQES
jgi:hypothetical protein